MPRRYDPMQLTRERPSRAGLEFGSKVVGVCAKAEALEQLTMDLANIGYSTVDASAGPVPSDAVAILISEDADPDFRVAAAHARRHRIILLSPDNGFRARLKAARTGVEAVLGLPVNTVELAAWLSEFEYHGSGPYSVLIVDDDPLIAVTYAHALESAGMQARIVTDPMESLDAISAATPDVMLLDFQMPGADGLEVARVIRQSRQNLALPIIFLSAERDADRQRLARRIGGDDFITKPVDMGLLVDRVQMRAERAVALRQLMERDSLTGLLNHARFKDRLAGEIARSRRTGSPVSVCLIDLDHFKAVNDTHGHQAGDRVIQMLAHALRARLRRSDVVARYGGEEFAAILLDTPQRTAVTVMNKIREVFALIGFEGPTEAFNVTLSVGLVEPQPFTSAEDAIAAADEALYEAKRTGRNRVVAANRPEQVGRPVGGADACGVSSDGT